MPECVDLFRPSEIYHASPFWVLTQNKSLMLWPVKLSRDGREKTWNTSVREAALAATTTWVRVVANHEINIYEPIAAEKDLGEPEWPHLTPTEALRIAFRNKCIDREDHAVIKRLRGLS